MSNNQQSNFFNKYFGEVDESQKVEIPVGGEFQQNGFIGPIGTKMVWRVWTAVDVNGPEFRDQAPTPISSRQLRNGDYHFFYTRPGDAERAIKAIGEDTRAEQYWVFSIPTDELLNSGNLEAVKEGFGVEVAYMSRVKTYRSKKYLHEFHLITLPSVIAAAANAMGIDNAGYDLSEISVNALSATDAWSNEYIGNPEGGNWVESVLGQRRKALWESLGEDDPLRYALDSARMEKFNVQSENMKACMKIVYYPPKQPLLGRLMNVLDPAIGAEYESESGEYKRRYLPAVTEFYAGLDEAKKVGDAEKAAIEANKPAEVGGGVAKAKAAPVIDPNAPKIPDAWTDMPAEWKEMIMEYAGKPDAKLKKDVAEKPNMFACDVDVALEWKTYLESK